MAIRHKLYAGRVVARTMVKHFERPDRLPRALAAIAPCGESIAGLVAGAAARYPTASPCTTMQAASLIREFWHRSEAIGAGLQEVGLDLA